MEKVKERFFTARVPAKTLDEFVEAAKKMDESGSQAVRRFMRDYIKRVNTQEKEKEKV